MLVLSGCVRSLSAAPSPARVLSCARGLVCRARLPAGRRAPRRARCSRAEREAGEVGRAVRVEQVGRCAVLRLRGRGAPRRVVGVASIADARLSARVARARRRGARARAGEASQHEARRGLYAFVTHRARRSCGAARPRLRGPDPPAVAGDGAGAASGSVGEGRGRGDAREGEARVWVCTASSPRALVAGVTYPTRGHADCSHCPLAWDQIVSLYLIRARPAESRRRTSAFAGIAPEGRLVISVRNR